MEGIAGFKIGFFIACPFHFNDSGFVYVFQVLIVVTYQGMILFSSFSIVIFYVFLPYFLTFVSWQQIVQTKLKINITRNIVIFGWNLNGRDFTGSRLIF